MGYLVLYLQNQTSVYTLRHRYTTRPGADGLTAPQRPGIPTGNVSTTTMPYLSDEDREKYAERSPHGEAEEVLASEEQMIRLLFTLNDTQP